MKKMTPRHILIQLLKTSDRENIKNSQRKNSQPERERKKKRKKKRKGKERKEKKRLYIQRNKDESRFLIGNYKATSLK